MNTKITEYLANLETMDYEKVRNILHELQEECINNIITNDCSSCEYVSPVNESKCKDCEITITIHTHYKRMTR